MADIINRAQMKKFILEKRKVLRPGWECTCVSKEALDKIDGKVRTMVEDLIEAHPTKGKTFKC